MLMRELGMRFSDGLSILVSSAVPEGKGVSSSAAVEVATMQALAAAHDIRLEGRQLALLCQKVTRHRLRLSPGETMYEQSCMQLYAHSHDGCSSSDSLKGDCCLTASQMPLVMSLRGKSAMSVRGKSFALQTLSQHLHPPIVVCTYRWRIVWWVRRAGLWTR